MLRPMDTFTFVGYAYFNSLGDPGLIPSKHSSESKTCYGGFTATNSLRARKALVGAAWKYIYFLRICVSLKTHQEDCSARVAEISQRAQKRMYN